MCGLLGLFRTSPSTPPFHPALVEKMRDTMSHRGPDDAGLYISPGNEIALGHRRLSIIDLSHAAVQPMATQDEAYWIVFNGEIYNHAELRKELEAVGSQFKTDHSDTEVILKGYEKWGEAILPKLRGMFAFAIWDKKNRKVWMARDRMGVKPLYYTMVGGCFMFASEIKALLEYPGVKREVDPHAFYDFLTFLASPAPRTLFKNIFKLPASHTLTVTDEGRMETKRYWNPFLGTGRIGELKEEEWTERIMHSLRESIRYRMVSDVNFGVFLSGGIDSSLNTALMAEQMDRPVDTFSIGFEGAEEFNELVYARMIADKFKTRHHEVIIDADDLVRFLPKLVFHQDEPIVDPVCVPVYYVAKLAKDNKTTVCQVGEGADELFCGYPYWGLMLDVAPWDKAFRMIPKPLRKMMFGAINSFFSDPAKGMRPLELMRRASNGESLFWGGAEAYQETAKRRFLNKDFLAGLQGYTSYEPLQQLWNDFKNDAPPEADTLHWMGYMDLRLRLPELLLMRVDKMTMATAVEARVPFLDQEFVRLSMSIPQKQKYKNGTLKYLLKKAVDPILPKEVVHRPKQGFAVPVETWFDEKLRAWSDKKIIDFVNRTSYFNRPVMEAWVRSSSSKMNWFLLNFVLWHEVWIEQRPLELPL